MPNLDKNIDRGPPTRDEYARLEALRISARLKEWPAEDSARRVLMWMRLERAGWREQRDRARNAARVREKKRAALDEWEGSEG